MCFGEKLQRLRAREGMSQEELAELLEVSRQAVSRWERNETMPETEKVIRISSRFQVTTDYLLKDGPERFCQAGRRLQRLPDIPGWYRRRGYLLCWALIAGGGLGCLWQIWSGLRSLQAAPDTWGELGIACFIWMAPGLILMAGGVLLLERGRRRAGNLRWYSMGWGAALLEAAEVLHWIREPVIWGILRPEGGDVLERLFPAYLGPVFWKGSTAALAVLLAAAGKWYDWEKAKK